MMRFLPNSLAARFTLVLAIALIVANAIAFFVLNFERDRELRDARRNSQIERLVTLVPALNALDQQLREDVVRASSGRRLRLRLANHPLIDASSFNDSDTKTLIEDIGQALDLPLGKDILVQTRDLSADERSRDSNRRHGQPQRTVVEIAIPLMDGTWLKARQMNFVPRQFRFARGAWLSLAFSFFGVLAVGLLFIRRLTKPLRDLTAAALRVGQGDQSKPLAESGAVEFRNTAHAFNTMQADIGRFNAERARTVAALGHDLRTPITSLRLRVEMVEDEGLREPMIQTLDDMKVMADELLHWGKSEEPLEPLRTLDLSKLLENICEPTGIKFLQSPSITISGRPVALRRAFTNIIENASRYADRGSAIVRLESDKAVVRIEDDGPGILKSQLDTIFDPFTRGETSRSKASGGTGLGLSIAKKIVESHDGTISIKNRSDGNGVIVSVVLPIATSTSFKAPV